MNVDFVNPFLSSLQNVLSMMAQIDLQPGKPALKKDDRARGDVSGLIGMIGPQTKGSFSISFEEGLAIEIMHKMLGEKPASIDDDVIDMVGEITNMVTGGAKRILGDKGFEFNMASPVVVSGMNHTIKHRSDGPRIIMPFNHAAGKAFLEICFDKV
ncbi:chemotaxis protein CheX [Aliidiomarina quisquiliarum]|uniref:chemotaxis protein CheX n=1 Tax=Aliidiomarina quisquiliarum TaxID=2938947 RepID=UPI00208FF059|nr:chemotaxis protein CheX [Aliidiomarina quisquiliarum]MCO4321877.1 chemotaxis protein CheX [Aliidiomarina quisquiliarum]